MWLLSAGGHSRFGMTRTLAAIDCAEGFPVNTCSGWYVRFIGTRRRAAMVGLLLLLAETGPVTAQPRARTSSADLQAPRLVVQSGPRNPIGLAITLSPDKQLIATAGGERSAAYIWQAETGRLVCTFKANMDQDMSFLMQGLPRMTFSADGSQLATANEHKVSVWDVRRCSLRRNAPSPGAASVLSGLLTLPDGQVLASSDSGTLYRGDLFAAAGVLQALPKGPHRSDLLVGLSRDGETGADPGSR